MTWHQAQERYGSDKPDVRFGLELVDLGEVFAATEFRAFQADVVKGIRLPGEGGMSRAQVDKLVDRAKQLGAGGLVWMRVVDGGALECQVLKFLSEAEQLGIVDTLGAHPGDLLLVAAGPRRLVDHVLGTLAGRARPPAGARGRPAVPVGGRLPAVRGPRRRRSARSPRTTRSPCRTPTTSRSSRTARARTCSRCGRSPTTSCSTAGSSARAACGSTGPTCSSRSSRCSASPTRTRRPRFGFLLDAFRYGAPPHAGFAFGIDRLAAILAGEDNIREVIAFPKTQSGTDPLTGAPTAIDPAQLKELGLSVLPRPKK